MEFVPFAAKPTAAKTKKKNRRIWKLFILKEREDEAFCHPSHQGRLLYTQWEASWPSGRPIRGGDQSNVVIRNGNVGFIAI
jgi:hypothetical protein